MNILLVTDAYPPEIRSISGMVKELADELALRGHKVTVVTCWPQCNLTDEGQNRNFDAFSIENGVEVIRVRTFPHHNVNYLIRGIVQLSLPYLFLMKIKKIIRRKIEAVIVYSPPLPLAKLGTVIKRIYNAKYILNVQDIFPQNAIDLGIIKNRLLIKFFERMEHEIYANADKITSHTKNGRKFLIEKKKIPEEKIVTVYNWVDFDIFRGARDNGVFRKRYGLKNNFIFLFPGILGPSQHLDFIIHVARRMIDIPDICFLFVGDGTEKRRLQKIVKEYGLQNVKFQPFVNEKEYPCLLKEIDVGLACLSAENRTPTMPGKILGFMASSIPVVAFVNKESDANDTLKEAQCGFSIVSDDIEKASILIRKVFSERDALRRYGQNGYSYVVTHFSKNACINKMEQLIKS